MFKSTTLSSRYPTPKLISPPKTQNRIFFRSFYFIYAIVYYVRKLNKKYNRQFIKAVGRRKASLQVNYYAALLYRRLFSLLLENLRKYKQHGMSRDVVTWCSHLIKSVNPPPLQRTECWKTV